MEKVLGILGLVLGLRSLLTLSWETTNHSPDCELVLAQVVYRHGDRNPIESYPTDPYKNESFWPEGYGQLTKIGKMQQYKLGQYIRERYEGFLNSTYSPYETYVQSSGVDRAIMSAEANLAGLYPPRDERSQWNPDLNWQPIPVHSKSNSIDNTIRYSELCPRYDELFQEFVTNSDVVQKVNAENMELFQLLTNYTGKNITSVHDAKEIMDVLSIQRRYNFTLPDWTSEIFPKYEERLEELAAFSVKMLTYTLELQRLRGGPLLKELIENMQRKMNETTEEAKRKLIVYSGHDTTVSSLLNTLDIYNNIMPPYASTVIIELHRNITPNTYFIEVLYRNTTGRGPFKMEIPGCAFSCDLSSFLELTRSRVPDDWEKECRPSGAGGYDPIGILVTASLLLILVGLFICAGLILKSYLWSKRRRSRIGIDGARAHPRKYPYLHLQIAEEDEEVT